MSFSGGAVNVVNRFELLSIISILTMILTQVLTIVTHTGSMSTHPSSVELSYGSYVPITYPYQLLRGDYICLRAHPSSIRGHE